MESMEFERHLVVLVDFDFDLLNEKRAVVSLYCADDDLVMVLDLVRPLEVYYKAERYPNHSLIAVILIDSTHFHLEIPAKKNLKKININHCNKENPMLIRTTHEFDKLGLLPAAPALFDPTDAFIC